MLLFVNVVGLKKIVFNKSVVYVLRAKKGDKIWVRKDPLKIRKDVAVTYDDMINNLHGLCASYPKNKLWVHGDTLNVTTQAVRKDGKDKKKGRKATKKAIIKEAKKLVEPTVAANEEVAKPKVKRGRPSKKASTIKIKKPKTTKSLPI